MPSDDDRPDLLVRLQARLRDWRGWAVRRELDYRGTYALVIRHADAGAFVAVCKSSLHQGDVSVMQRAVEAARRGGSPVAIFVGTAPTLGRAWAFHPATVERRGETVTLSTKKGVEVEAYQLSPDHGVLLGDVVSGREAVEPPVRQVRFGRDGGLS